MKKMFKKVICLVLCLLGVFVLASCNGEKEVKRITIIQFVSASALDDARDGVIESLEAKGFVNGDNVEIVVQNPQGDFNTLGVMAQNAVKNSDLIIAIATPVAQAVKAECEKQMSDVPVLFTAVTDPVQSDLVASNDVPGANITGTNDMNPVKEQIELIKKLNPEAKKVGIIYTSSEANSLIQVNIAKEAAAKEGLEVATQTVTNVNDIKTMIEALVSKGVDAIYLPTDNNISSAITTVTSVTNEAGIPTICGEEGMLTGNGTITLGINYKNLGIITGEMAAEVLNGADISNMSVKGLTNFTLVINKKAAIDASINIPEALLEEADRVIE